MDRFTTLLICGGVLLFLWVTVLGLIFSDLWCGTAEQGVDGEAQPLDIGKRYRVSTFLT